MKFRAYNTTKKEWVTDVCLTLDGTVGYCSDDEGFVPLHGNEKVEVTQWTGLYDRNGKEIYEGDIFKWQLKEGDKTDGVELFFGLLKPPDVEDGALSEDFEEIAVVEWKGSWILVGQLDNKGFESRLDGEFVDGRTRNKCGEVVGNIYENPELLKD